MPTITVKNIPQSLYEDLKRSANDNHRSLNREIIACIERGVGSGKIDPEALVAEASRLRTKWRGRPLSDAQILKAVKSGRP